MSNFQDNSVMAINPELRGKLLKEFLERNNLTEEVDNDVVYGTYIVKEETMGIGGGFSEVEHEGWNYLGNKLEANPYAPVLTTKPTVLDNTKLQFLVCVRYGILKQEDFFKSFDEVQADLRDQYIELKTKERERVIAQITKLQEQLHSIDVDLENAKERNSSPRL